MPTYDYECEACGHEFELFQKMSDKPVRVCPKCKKRRVRRLIGSGGALLFKGSGFYITDYRSEEYKSRAKADSSSGKKESSGSDSSSSDSSKKPTKEKDSKGSSVITSG